MPFQPVFDAVANAASYQSRDMFQYNPNTVTPPGTGTAIANAAGASTPPLNTAPSTKNIINSILPSQTYGLSPQVQQSQADILNTANAQRARTNQMFGMNLPAIPAQGPAAIAQIKQSNLANAARAAWEPPGRR